MKFWGSLTSPYVRKVRATLEHHQLAYEFLPVEGNAFNAQSAHNKVNPLGKVPALETKEGLWLCDSSVIVEYLDELGCAEKLFPSKQDIVFKNDLALVHGILENTTSLMIPEKMFRPESEWWLSRHQQIFERNRRSIPILAQQLERFGTELNMVTLVSVCLVDYFKVRDGMIQMTDVLQETGLIDWAKLMNEKYHCLKSTLPPT